MEKTVNKPFIICSTCGTKVSSYWSLNRHTRTHSGVKPFKCKVRECGKEFIESCALRRHEQTHTDCRQWICDFQDCSRKFKLKEYLDIHKRSHREELNLACQPCNNDRNGSSIVSSSNIYLGRFKRPYRERAIKKANSKEIILKRCLGSSKSQSITTEKTAETNSFNSHLIEKNHFQQLISLHKMHDSLSYPSLPLPSPELLTVHHPHSFPLAKFCAPNIQSPSKFFQNFQYTVPNSDKNDYVSPASYDNILNSTTATTITTSWGISTNAPSSISGFPVHEYHRTDNNILSNELVYNPIEYMPQEKIFSQQIQYPILPACPSLEQQQQQQYQYKEYYTSSSALTPTTSSAPHATDISSIEETVDYLQELHDDDLASIFHFDLDWDL